LRDLAEDQSDTIKPTKFCRRCGAKIPRDSKYCEECGGGMIEAASPRTPPESEEKRGSLFKPWTWDASYWGAIISAPLFCGAFVSVLWRNYVGAMIAVAVGLVILYKTRPLGSKLL